MTRRWHWTTWPVLVGLSHRVLWHLNWQEHLCSTRRRRGETTANETASVYYAYWLEATGQLEVE